MLAYLEYNDNKSYYEILSDITDNQIWKINRI